MNSLFVVYQYVLWCHWLFYIWTDEDFQLHSLWELSCLYQKYPLNFLITEGMPKSIIYVKNTCAFEQIKPLYITSHYYYYYYYYYHHHHHLCYHLYAGYLQLGTETNHIARVYSVAAVLCSQFVLHVKVFRPWHMICILTLALSVVCVQYPMWLFFCSSLISCFPSMSLKYCLSDVEIYYYCYYYYYYYGHI